MEQQFPMALEVMLVAASGAIIVLSAVLVYAAWAVRKHLTRIVRTVENVEAELVPLARETRVVVDRLRDLSERAQRDWTAMEHMIGAVRGWADRTQEVVGTATGVVMQPVRAINRTAQLVQTGVTTFLQALWNGHSRTDQRERPS